MQIIFLLMNVDAILSGGRREQVCREVETELEIANGS